MLSKPSPHDPTIVRPFCPAKPSLSTWLFWVFAPFAAHDAWVNSAHLVGGKRPSWKGGVSESHPLRTQGFSFLGGFPVASSVYNKGVIATLASAGFLTFGNPGSQLRSQWWPLPSTNW